MSPPVILYRYDGSPFSHKIDNALLLKGIPHQNVQVAPMLPRPEITEELGINYRRIPLLAIGNDVYCDTGLIVSALERRFPSSQGYQTLFPPTKSGKTDTGLAKLFAKYYAESALFTPATTLIPWEKLPAPFLKDRSEASDLRGAPINTAALAGSRDNALSQLSSQLTLIEEQLRDGREWLLDTEHPGLADISVHFTLAWIKAFKPAKPLFDETKFPNVLKWLDRLSSLLKAKRKEQGAPAKITGAVAGDAIVSSDFETYSVVGFDAQEGQRLRVQLGDTVRIAPEDTGRNYPTTGKLVALSLEEAVLEVQGKKGPLRCHFPRLGYFIKVVKDSKL